VQQVAGGSPRVEPADEAKQRIPAGDRDPAERQGIVGRRRQADPDRAGGAIAYLGRERSHVVVEGAVRVGEVPDLVPEPVLEQAPRVEQLGTAGRRGELGKARVAHGMGAALKPGYLKLPGSCPVHERDLESPLGEEPATRLPHEAGHQEEHGREAACAQDRDSVIDAVPVPVVEAYDDRPRRQGTPADLVVE
jgi:hypothetical protein